VQRTETLLTLAEMQPKRFATQLIESMRAALDGQANHGGTT
jgi:hypothetical protein